MFCSNMQTLFSSLADVQTNVIVFYSDILSFSFRIGFFPSHRVFLTDAVRVHSADFYLLMLINLVLKLGSFIAPPRWIHVGDVENASSFGFGVLNMIIFSNCF